MVMDKVQYISQIEKRQVCSHLIELCSQQQINQGDYKPCQKKLYS